VSASISQLDFVIKKTIFTPMIFTESPAFSRKVYEVLSEDELIALEYRLVLSPDSGDVIPGAGGLRKIRVASGGKGKRGGSRVIYYWYVNPEKIQFCRIYEKSSQADLPKSELRKILNELEP
jgi:mRNA-degrading endonuclease RelE of RelBE toxin-antitoxin system